MDCYRTKNAYKDPDDGRQRFLLELEFMQCLANPTYIHYLAQNRYFEDEAFIAYLKYLQYWQQPEYIKFIMYPHCLYFLELLQNPNFRTAMAYPANKAKAHSTTAASRDYSSSTTTTTTTFSFFAACANCNRFSLYNTPFSNAVQYNAFQG
ncbi:unnamed protein product [Cochlearia groenlandica]